jgi:hypothetical protein
MDIKSVAQQASQINTARITQQLSLSAIKQQQQQAQGLVDTLTQADQSVQGSNAPSIFDPASPRGSLVNIVV